MDSSNNSSSISIHKKDSEESVRLVDTSSDEDDGWRSDLGNRDSSQERKWSYTVLCDPPNISKESIWQNKLSNNTDELQKKESSCMPEYSLVNADPVVTLDNVTGERIMSENSIYRERPCIFAPHERHFFKEPYLKEKTYRDEFYSGKRADQDLGDLKWEPMPEGNPTICVNYAQKKSKDSNAKSMVIDSMKKETLKRNQTNQIQNYESNKKCSDFKLLEVYGKPAARTRNSTNLSIRQNHLDVFGNWNNMLSFGNDVFFKTISEDCFINSFSEEENKESSYFKLLEDSDHCSFSYTGNDENNKTDANQSKTDGEKASKERIRRSKCVSDREGKASMNSVAKSISQLQAKVYTTRIRCYPSDPLFEKHREDLQFKSLKSSKSCDSYRITKLYDQDTKYFPYFHEELCQSESGTPPNLTAQFRSLSNETLLSGTGHWFKKMSDKDWCENISRHTHEDKKGALLKANEEGAVKKRLDTVRHYEHYEDNTPKIHQISKKTAISRYHKKSALPMRLDHSRTAEVLQDVVHEKSALPKQRFSNEYQSIYEKMLTRQRKNFIHVEDIPKHVNCGQKHTCTYQAKKYLGSFPCTSSKFDLDMIELEILSHHSKDHGNKNNNQGFPKDDSDDSLDSYSSDKETGIEQIVRDIECNYNKGENNKSSQECSSLSEKSSDDTFENKRNYFPGARYHIESNDSLANEMSKNNMSSFSFQQTYGNDELQLNHGKSRERSHWVPELSHDNKPTKSFSRKYEKPKQQSECSDCIRKIYKNCLVDFKSEKDWDKESKGGVVEEAICSDPDLLHIIGKDSRETICSLNEQDPKKLFKAISTGTNLEISLCSECQSTRNDNENEENRNQKHNHSTLSKLKEFVVSRFFRNYHKRGFWCISLSTEESAIASSINSVLSTNSMVFKHVESSRGMEHNVPKHSQARSALLEETEAGDLYFGSIKKMLKTNLETKSTRGKEACKEKKKTRFWQRQREIKQQTKKDATVHDDVENIFPEGITMVHPRPPRYPCYSWTCSRHLPRGYTANTQNSEEEVCHCTEQEW